MQEKTIATMKKLKHRKTFTVS